MNGHLVCNKVIIQVNNLHLINPTQLIKLSNNVLLAYVVESLQPSTGPRHTPLPLKLIDYPLQGFLPCLSIFQHLLTLYNLYQHQIHICFFFQRVCLWSTFGCSEIIAYATSYNINIRINIIGIFNLTKLGRGQWTVNQPCISVWMNFRLLIMHPYNRLIGVRGTASSKYTIYIMHIDINHP